MSRKSSVRGRRAWDVLRLALVWARRGGVFRNRLVINMSLLQKGIRKLRHSHHGQPGPGALIYGERELSFDDTPVIHVKMHRPSSLRFKMPCIKTQVDFDYDLDLDLDLDFDFDDEIYGQVTEEAMDDQVNAFAEDEAIDLKAEEFIANFYNQMKLQRQISYLEYNQGNDPQIN